MYYISELVIVSPFNCISIKQNLNHFNTYFNKKKNLIQAICSINISKPSPLLIILILTYIRNPFSLSLSPLNLLINGIFINLHPYLSSYCFNASQLSVNYQIIFLNQSDDCLLVLPILVSPYVPDGPKIKNTAAGITTTSTALSGILYYCLSFYCNFSSKYIIE